ncbi:MAG: rRNA maturation RNase YbeY [Gammaproteobacteria bacterium]|jgi:probable rRNA maturation factor|nr:rRNA maturation RNase YbeY [Gammaproteobacteria bacterium]
MTLSVEVQRRVRTWAPPRADIAAWAGTALGRKAAGRELGVRVVGPTESRRLNARYRGRDKPTNVLSFPAAEVPAGRSKVPQATLDNPIIRPLGDLVICPHVLRAEARQQHKSLRAHWAHLVVHGALHLVGYDHEDPADANRMERREVSVLRRLGFPNPYRSS